METQSLPTVYVPRGSAILPDGDQWQFRFEIHSETSNRVYTVAQHKSKLHWACSCPGWKAHRKCKHLTAIGLPNHEKPFQVNIVRR